MLLRSALSFPSPASARDGCRVYQKLTYMNKIVSTRQKLETFARIFKEGSRPVGKQGIVLVHFLRIPTVRREKSFPLASGYLEGIFNLPSLR